MNEISCIIIVGKPGAGKSSIGNELAKLLGSHYMSLGTFMRETLGIPDPHVGIDKNMVYDKLHTHFTETKVTGSIIIDCHPYPEKDFVALESFILRPSLNLEAVIHVDAHDHIALERLARRPRPGQSYEDRLKYYNDNSHYIAKLMNHPHAIRIENNVDFEDPSTLKDIARDILNRLNQKN